MNGGDSLDGLRDRLRTFAQERHWEQFHTAKNLTTAVAGEAGELAAVLQWATPDEDLSPYMSHLEEEVADVLIYLVRLCDIAGINPLAAVNAKVDRNESRFRAPN